MDSRGVGVPDRRNEKDPKVEKDEVRWCLEREDEGFRKFEGFRPRLGP